MTILYSVVKKQNKCKNCRPLIMDFWQEFLTAGRQGKYFLFSI